MNKKIFTFTSGLATGLLCFILASADRSITSTSIDALPDIEGKRFNNVPINEFFKDVARYKGTHLRLVEPDMPSNRRTFLPIPDGRPKEASRMFIYSIATLEDFFKVIRDCAAQANIPSSKLAIRFYYGVYPKEKNVAHRDYTNLHTLFMVPNYWSKADGRYRDFDIRKLAQALKSAGGYGNKNPEDFIAQYFFENIYATNPNQEVFMLDASTVKYNGGFPLKSAGFFGADADELPVINQGQLCPPNCPTVTPSLLNTIDANFTNIGWND